MKKQDETENNENSVVPKWDLFTNWYIKPVKRDKKKSTESTTKSYATNHDNMITLYKTEKGMRWLAVSSTAYRDKDGEIVSIKALRDAVSRSPKDLGPLRWWHEPGVDLGTTDFQTVTDDGKYLVESGMINDAKIGAAMQEALKSQRYQMSIGFRHPPTEPDANKVFNTIDIFERSILPEGKASNPYTSFGIGE